MGAHKRVKEGCFVELGSAKLVFEPGNVRETAVKKYPCADCHFCQFCSDSRCAACRQGKRRPEGSLSRKLSIREQIQLYDAINSKETS